MYKKAFIVLLALISLTGQAEERKVISQTDGSITFVVDEGLEPITERYKHFYDGEQMAKAILSKDKTIFNDAYYNIVATSFADAKNLRNPEKDAFFQSVLRAYKMHKSLTLSPDMVWLLISQGFARYVNAHSEALRPQLVNHAGKMDLAIKTEQDLFSDEPTDGYDYVIGAVHYLRIGGKYLTVDWKPELLLQAADLLGDIYAAAELYYDEMARVAEIPGCSVIAHFDLFRKLNRDGSLFDRDHPRYRSAWRKAADRLLLSGLPFEINTGAISRGYQSDPYPDAEIIDYLAARGARFLLGSDSHRKDTLLCDFDRQEKLAREKGLTLLSEYVSRMKPDQKYIYYASGGPWPGWRPPAFPPRKPPRFRSSGNGWRITPVISG